MNKKLFVKISLLLIVHFSLFIGQTKAQEEEKEIDYKKFGIETEDVRIPKGLEVGTMAPEFQALDQNGKQIELEDLYQKGPVVLIFYRGSWCGVCNRYMKQLEDSIAMIKKTGASVIAITPEMPQNVAKTIEKTKSSLRIISDKNEEIMDAYDVSFVVTEEYEKKVDRLLRVNLIEHNAQDKTQLPVPATYIINQKGEIVYVHFDVNYRNRASIKTILENLP